MTAATTIREAAGDADIATIRRLFMAYAKSHDFGVCFQDFEQELAALPGRYAPPRGALWLAHQGRAVVGCIALRPLDEKSCEMKRLYVVPGARRQGLGRRLAEHCLTGAAGRGYQHLYLDTMATEMTAAIALYLGLGFRQTAPYCGDPLPGIVYYSRDLPA